MDEAMKNINDYFKESGEPIKCTECGYRAIVETIIEKHAADSNKQGDWVIGEANYECGNCHKLLGYFSCGYWESSFKNKFMSSKPPLGLMPRKICLESRKNDILQAMDRYYKARKVIPDAWIMELLDIRIELGEVISESH